MYTDLDVLPNMLRKKYALLRDLDKSLQGMLKLICKLKEEFRPVFEVNFLFLFFF